MMPELLIANGRVIDPSQKMDRLTNVLIDNGNETEWNLSPQRTPHHSAPDLYTAATMIAAIEREGVAGGEAATQ